jgi:hypothetical protein
LSEIGRKPLNFHPLQRCRRLRAHGRAVSDEIENSIFRLSKKAFGKYCAPVFAGALFPEKAA